VTLALQILVWDQPDEPPEPPAGIDATWGWRSFAQVGAICSIPRYVENHAQQLRQKYLAFIHDLGERQIAGRRVIDHFDLGDGFSLWWMTLLAEKSPLKSPGIYAVLRLLALEEILTDKRPTALLLISYDRALVRAVRRLCENLHIEFRWRSAGISTGRLSLRGLYDALPHALKGLLSLRHLVKRWPLRTVGKPPWFAGDDALFICSYFIHLDPVLCEQGRFHSRQWEDLPELLHAAGRRTNWIQLFLFSAAVPDIATGLGWIRRFNRDASKQGCQSFLDSYLTLRNVLLAVKHWLWLLRVGWRLRPISSLFYPSESSVWLWPILHDDWWSSVAGTVAMSNCLSIVLFDAALADMPRQRTGLYLCENQSWEKALLHAWRRYGHGEIIGVQHATVPFWHLYYFDDPRCLTSKEPCALPLPDRLAANGSASRQAFSGAQYPPERLVEVEALRYLNLREVVARRNSASRWLGGKWASGSGWRVVRVLVLGDLIPASMDHLLRLVQKAMPLVPPKHEFTLKPHPGLAVDLRDYPGVYAGETREALGHILPDYDIAVAANCTSAAVDAFVAGLPVIIALDGDGLNLSPLRGQQGVHFVSTGAELAEALQTAGFGVSTSSLDRAEFFFLDADLPRWKRLLAVGAPI
jgi:surface carbohydrate biosynthesis protein (TIGR04326 family)